MFCFIYKALLSHALDEDKAVPRLVQRHVRKCNKCRAFWRQTTDIHRKLSLEVPISKRGFVVFLREKIMLNIVQEQQKNPPTNTVRVLASWQAAFLKRVAVAAGILFILWGGAIWFFTSGQADKTPQPAQRILLSNLLDTTKLIQPWDLKNASAANPAALSEYMEMPFIQEVENLQKDTKNAADSLLNCLNVRLVADNK